MAAGVAGGGMALEIKPAPVARGVEMRMFSILSERVAVVGAICKTYAPKQSDLSNQVPSAVEGSDL